MNNPYFIFLIRRDHVLGLTVHLAAGILALVLLTGVARAENPTVSTRAASSAVANR
jgi:hypothetical protein